MINDVLPLDRPLIVLDTETTGVNPQRDRIIELSFQLFTAEGLQKEWRSLVNPGVSIPKKVTEITGIDNARMMRCRYCDEIPLSCTCPDGFKLIPGFKAFAGSIAKGFNNCDFAGKNVRFDLRILDAEMQRHEQPWSYAGARIIDADRLEQLGEPRTLTHLYRKHLGHDFDGAHGALADVKATVEVIEAQLRKYELPFDLTVLHEQQWPDWITQDGHFKFEDGIPVCCFGKHRGTPMHEIPVSFFDWMLGKDFPEDVKQLVRQAKLGRYPEKTVIER